MAKKEEKVSFKSLLNQFMQKSLQSLISVIAKHADHLMDWVENIPSIKRKIRKLITAIIILTAGLGILGVGVAQYIASLYPKLSNGLSYMIVGIVLMLIAAFYLKFNE